MGVIKLSVKIALENYFDKMLEGYNKTSQGFPMRPKRNLVKDEIYIGEKDEDGWCRWRPIKKNIKSEFDEIEKFLKIDINEDIKEYFNSYWFLELEGTFKKRNINLQEVIPGKELDNFILQLKEYVEYYQGDTKYIPIGMDDNSEFLIVVENSTGIIKKENIETGKRRVLAKNLCELINNLEPTIIDFHV